MNIKSLMLLYRILCAALWTIALLLFTYSGLVLDVIFTKENINFDVKIADINNNLFMIASNSSIVVMLIIDFFTTQFLFKKNSNYKLKGFIIGGWNLTWIILGFVLAFILAAIPHIKGAENGVIGHIHISYVFAVYVVILFCHKTHLLQVNHINKLN
ncbi:MAG: hypothetical protein LBF69_07665 [Prevotellaceae bacterium]|nr:hypothetical protein [Prevotellaceae bacterium]